MQPGAIVVRWGSGGPSRSLLFLCPNVVVLAAPPASVEATRARLEAEGLVAMSVAADRAFRSPMVEPIALELERQFAGIALRGPERRIVSSISGVDLTVVQATDPSYWAHILSRPVRFADALGQLGDGEEHILVEVGPGSSLTALALTHPDARRVEGISRSQQLGRERAHNCPPTALSALATGLNRRLSLPTRQMKNWTP